MEGRRWNCSGALNVLALRENGQELVEYALVFAVIALGATASLQSVAGGVNAVFTSIPGTLASATA